MKNENGEKITPKDKAKEILNECINGAGFSEMWTIGSASLTEKQKVKVLEQIDKLKIRLNKIVVKKVKVSE